MEGHQEIHTVLAHPEKTRVLLVEDHAVNQKVVTRMLERLGCFVDVADDGEIGVERTHRRPSLILMDCSMPRCDGYEATRRIRALSGDAARTPIVALTAHATPADRERCMAVGMDDWIAKPVAPSDLVGALRKFTFWTPESARGPVEGIIDPRVIEQLVALGGTDDPEFFPELVGEFRSTADSALKEAQSSFDSGRFADLRRTIHRLKSASATLGAIRLRETCSRLEAADDVELGANGTTWLDLAAREVGLAAAALASAPGVAR